ncbi:MAG: hypothetical protein ABI811_01625 [Acidobacteriota bacterium]
MFEFLAVWYQPAIGALHVLGIAWFGGMLLTEDRGLRTWRWAGLVLMLATGILLFTANAAHVWNSSSFRIKLLLLLALVFVRQPRWLVLTLWAAVVFASRGIAYF